MKFRTLSFIILSGIFVNIAVAIPDHSDMASTETADNTTGNGVIEAKINLLEAQINDMQSKIAGIEVINAKLATLEQQVTQNQVNIAKLIKYIKSKMSPANTALAKANPTSIVSGIKEKTAGLTTSISSAVGQKITNARKDVTQGIAKPMLSNASVALQSAGKTAQNTVNSTVAGISGLATSGRNVAKNAINSIAGAVQSGNGVIQKAATTILPKSPTSAIQNDVSKSASDMGEDKLTEISGDDLFSD